MNGNNKKLPINFLDVLRKMQFYFKKYLVIWILAGLFSSLVWMKLVSFFIIDTYTSDAVLKLELSNNRERTIEPDVSTNPRTALEVLYTRSFLKGVIEKLKFRFLLMGNKKSRSEVLDYVDYDESALPGLYEFEIKNGYLSILFASDRLGKKDELILHERMTDLDTIRFNGIKVVFNQKIKEKIEGNYIFRFMDMTNALNLLQKSIMPRLTNSFQFLLINVTFFDKYLTRDIANTMAREFIKQTIYLKNIKTQKAIQKLETQLKASKAKLDSIEDVLREFRQRNPRLAGEGNSGSILSEIERINEESRLLMSAQENIRQILETINNLNFEEKLVTINELVGILSANNVTSAAILSSQLTQSNARYQQLIAQYPAEHPTVLDVKKEIDNIITQIRTLAQNSLNDFNARVKNNQKLLRNLNMELNRLPSKELILARLVRERDLLQDTYSQISRAYNDLNIQATTLGQNVFLIDEALLPKNPPVIKVLFLKYVMGLIVFILSPVFLIFVLSYFDKKVFFKDELESVINSPVLATIPIIDSLETVPHDDPVKLKGKIDPKITTFDYSPSIANEAFRSLRASIINKMGYLEEKKSLMVVSYFSSEGKSLVCSNLAVTFAQNKIPTILIDTDMRRGVLHNSLVCKRTPGLSNLLTLRDEFFESDAVLDKVIQKTQIPNLYLISCGESVPNPAELLSSKKMEILINRLKNKFGMVILDTPPLGLISDAINLLKFIDNSILVVMSKKTKKNQIEHLYSEISFIVKDHLLGVVLNGSDEKTEKDKYSYSYYGY
ncbi:MAG: hypothetical protein Kow00108_00310 [Calditrichia bacterium]